MSSPLVSVIIPAYNYGRFVSEAVDSVLGQSYPHVEIIVVDDGSQDDTRQRLAVYGDRIRYFYQENQGLPAARNTGIRHSTGELIAFLDADDTWHPRKLEIQVAFLTGCPDLGLLATAHTTERGALDKVAAEPVLQLTPITLEDLALRCWFGPGGVVARKRCFEAVGLFDPSLRSAEDRDMWIRIASRFPIAKLGLPLWWYRDHPGCMRHVALRMEENELKVLDKAFSELAALRSRILLRRKVYSYALFESAYRFTAAGEQGAALKRLGRSLWLWPWPYRRAEVRFPFIRPRMLLVMLLRLLRLKTTRPNPGALQPVGKPQTDVC